MVDRFDDAPARTWVDVDLSALRHNTAVLTPPESTLLVMVKGNAYGHGAVEVARTVLDAGAQWLGVSFVDEGIALRAARVDAPTLVTTEAAAGEEARALRAGLDLTVYSRAAIDRLGRAGQETGIRPRVHLKVNTGLNRVGVATAGALGLVGHAVGAGLDVRGVWTHFAVADDVDHPATALQLARLRDAVRDITAAGHPTGLLHAANTAAILAHPGAHLDLVRAGIGIYGLSPDAALPGAGDLVPVLSWRTTVTYVKRVEAGEGVSYGFTARTARPATVATIPVGFADGYPRCLSNRGEALIRGTRFPILGTIAMDQMLVDCGDDVVDVGDEVVLIGRQGSHVVTAEELAGLAGTIVDEILCGISTRVPRRYSA